MKLIKRYLEDSNYHFLIHRSLYLLGLATIFCGLGWSNILMSIGQFIILGNWILELDFSRKWKSLKENKLVWILLSLILLHFIGLLWTSDFSYGFRDIEKKLPLLLLPVVLASSKKLEEKELYGLLGIYLITLFILTIASYFKLFGWTNEEIIDKRELSIYISHIRYGLNISLAIFISFLLAKRIKRFQLPLFGLALWFTASLVLFELYTGILTFLFASSILLINQLLKSDIKIITKLTPLLILTAVFYYCFSIIKRIQTEFSNGISLNFDQESFKGTKSKNGNYYWNEPDIKIAENGVYVWRFIAKKEVEKQWNKRSTLAFNGLDKKGQKLETTVYRFLSSKGLKKDSVGMEQLTNAEIKAIENGIANAYYLNHSPIENRIHRSFYEFENYQKRGIASGFSLVMRIEYWKTAIKIFKQNWLFGVGTGDVKESFKEQYKKDKSTLSEQYRRRAHNQYLTIALTFGLIGFFIFILFLLYPIWKVQLYKNPLYLSFFIIACLSFITEDTLETQAGVTFFAFFNTLFILGIPKSLK